MFRMVLGFSCSMFLLPFGLLGQKVSHADTIQTSPEFQLIEYYVQVPLGQTFIAPGRCGGQTLVRYHLPKGISEPICQVDTTPDLRLRSTISMGTQTQTSYTQNQSVSRGANAAAVSYSVSGSITIDDDPSKYIMELSPDASIPMAMKMNLGYGSARIDLTDLKVKALEIVSGAADVIISYAKESPCTMRFMHISSGMSKIVVRNLDYARAENVHIENGMGDTKIVVGADIKAKSMVHIGVGTGKCTLLVHKDAPVKVIIHGTVFSSAEVPEGYINTGNNTFVSHSYKMNSHKAMTIVIDLGIGGFEMIPFENFDF